MKITTSKLNKLTTKPIATVPTLLLAALAVNACAEPTADSDGAIDFEPGDQFEVYHQDAEGTQHTLGYYEPAADVFSQVPVDWNFDGYSFETDDGALEVFGTDVAFSSEASLELGASYDATVWTSSDGGDAFALGFIAVDDVPADVTIDAAANNYCRTTVSYKWARFKAWCNKVKTTRCKGGASSRSTSVTFGWRCW